MVSYHGQRMKEHHNLLGAVYMALIKTDFVAAQHSIVLGTPSESAGATFLALLGLGTLSSLC